MQETDRQISLMCFLKKETPKAYLCYKNFGKILINHTFLSKFVDFSVIAYYNKTVVNTSAYKICNINCIMYSTAYTGGFLLYYQPHIFHLSAMLITC